MPVSQPPVIAVQYFAHQVMQAFVLAWCK